MSHVNMQVFWSGTDTATIKELASQGWIAATVFNKKEEMRSAVGYQAKTPFGDSVEVQDNIGTHIMDDFSGNTKEWDKEYDANVEKKCSPLHLQSEYNWRDNDYAWPNSYPKHGSLLQKPKELEEERAAYTKDGYWGYGAEKEARILGIAPKVYVAKLLTGSHQEVEELGEQLEMAILKGELY